MAGRRGRAASRAASGWPRRPVRRRPPGRRRREPPPPHRSPFAARLRAGRPRQQRQRRRLRVARQLVGGADAGGAAALTGAGAGEGTGGGQEPLVLGEQPVGEADAAWVVLVEEDRRLAGE